jgi:hypothetical protein
MATLNERLIQLEQQIEALQEKVIDLSANTEETLKKPYVIAGGNKSSTSNMPIDAKTGLGPLLANHVIWNDSERFIPPLNAEPPNPGKGYNKHSHSRYSGGALIKDKLEIVEYEWGSIVNKDSQQFWVNQPLIKTDKNTKGETVNKIGLLDLFFNPDTLTWGVSSYEIDIKKCYLVERVTVIDINNPTIGAIKKDSKLQEMKAPLYNTDQTKSSIIWDESGKCWRFYAVYSPGTPTGV